MFQQSVNRTTENGLPGAVGKTFLSELGASKSQELDSDLATYGQVKDEQDLPWRTPHTGVPRRFVQGCSQQHQCVTVESWTQPSYPSSRDRINSDEFRQWKILHAIIFKIGESKPHASVKMNLKKTNTQTNTVLFLFVIQLVLLYEGDGPFASEMSFKCFSHVSYLSFDPAYIF